MIGHGAKFGRSSAHPDLEGLCLALADWLAELRILVGDVAQNRKARRGLWPGGRKGGKYRC
jgi:hypothetical protein